MHTVFVIVEAIAQHPTLLLEFHPTVIDKLLPPLSQLVSSTAGDTRAQSLRLFSEMAGLYLNQEQFDPIQHKNETQKLHHITLDTLLPQ